MPHAVPSRLIGELTFLEISTFISKSSILCLPIGSIEQHGPHLPLNTDVVLAEEFTRRIVARWAPALDLWQLPTISMSGAASTRPTTDATRSSRRFSASNSRVLRNPAEKMNQLGRRFSTAKAEVVLRPSLKNLNSETTNMPRSRCAASTRLYATGL